MKKTAGLISLFFLISTIFAGATSAVVTDETATAEATASPSAAVVDKQIQNLKDKIANKVAELNKSNKAYAGNIVSVKESVITIKTKDEQNYEVKVDSELTKIYSITGTVKKEIKKEDLTKNDYIIASGPIIDKTIEANSIYLDEQYLVRSGKVTEVNNTDYYIKVSTTEKDNFTLDIETYTKINLVNIKTLEMEKSGFSKIKEGDTVHFVVKKTGEEKELNRYSAQKILVIPQEYFIK